MYALLAGSLDAVTLEDVNDMNTVEYALISDAPIEVITLLQITCNPQTVNAIVPAIKPSGNHLLRISGVLSTVFNRIFFLKKTAVIPFGSSSDACLPLRFLLVQ